MAYGRGIGRTSRRQQRVANVLRVDPEYGRDDSYTCQAKHEANSYMDRWRQRGGQYASRGPCAGEEQQQSCGVRCSTVRRAVAL